MTINFRLLRPRPSPLHLSCFPSSLISLSLFRRRKSRNTMSTESPEAQGHDHQRPIKRLRFAPRTNLACTACRFVFPIHIRCGDSQLTKLQFRRRKTRCSGEFPTCSACSSRNEECIFEGIRAQVTVRASEDAREIARESTRDPARGVVQPALPVENGCVKLCRIQELCD